MCKNTPSHSTIAFMEQAGERSWIVDLLADYPPMMTLHEVAGVLNISPDKLRSIVRHRDPEMRITGVKINGAWRFPRDELAAYLYAHAYERSEAGHA